MANVFDQFDAGTTPSPSASSGAGDEGNVFDQFDGSQTKKTSVADPGMVNTILSKGFQGVTAGFGDEIAALPRSILSGTSYADALAREREILQGAEEHHPIASAASEIGGGLGTMLIPGLGEINAVKAASLVPKFGRAAGAISRLANSGLTGAAYGAAYGAGSADGDLADRGAGMLSGAAFGAGTGLAAPVLGGAARGVLEKVNPFRGALNPEAAAARRVVDALERDNVTQPDAEGVLRAAQARGVPAVLGDVPALISPGSGETVRSLARSAKNTSPEAAGVLQGATSDRFADQGDRFQQLVRNIVGPTNATAKRDALEAAAKRQNKPAYARAYTEGDRSLWSPELERLSGSPAVISALKAAVTTGKDRAITEGFGGFRPGVLVDKSGNVSFPKGPTGVPTYPNLQFWDHTRRELSDAASAAARAGNKGQASVLGGLAKGLNSELDRLVPSYQNARQGAAAAFGAEDALDAGQKFFSSRMGNDDARKAVAKLKPAEKSLFAEGYASDLISKVREGRDRTSVVKSVIGSPAARERAEIALGPQSARRLDSFLRVENTFDMLRNAVQGNSTTAKQLIEAGMAGGALNVISGNGNWNDPSTLLTAALGAAARKGTLKIDQRVVNNVARMLASNDPQVVAKAYRMAGSSPAIAKMFRTAETNISRLVGPFRAGGAQAAHAEDDQD